MPTAGTVLRGLFCLTLISTIVPMGSVDSEPLHLSSLFFFSICLAAIVLLPLRTKLSSLFSAGVFFALTLIFWVLIQASNSLPFVPANAVWMNVQALAGPAMPALSVAPSDTLQALIPLIMPFIVFLTGILIFSSSYLARAAIVFYCQLGVFVAVFSILEFYFLPGRLLLDIKSDYLDSLTATFVNRNTAATFLGITLLLCFALALERILNFSSAELNYILKDNQNIKINKDLIWGTFYLVAASVVFVALMLTKSRAGIGATILATFIMLVLLICFPARKLAKSDLRSTLIKAGLIGSVLAVATLFGGARVLLRVQVQGTEDGRFCVLNGMMQLMRDNWIWGAGLGTFRDVFPAYRNPECGIDGVWEMAHNSYIEGWATLGLPFVLVLIAVTVTLIRAFMVGIEQRERLRWMPILGLSVMILGLAHSFFDFSLQIPGVAVYWAAILSATAVGSKVKQSGPLRQMQAVE